MTPRRLPLLLCALIIGWLPRLCLADVTQVAVAANFADPIKAIAKMLHQATGHELKVTLGATGTLYAQITNGAPFDVLLAANTAVPAALEKDGLTLPGSRFTYATGKLVLWSAERQRVDAAGDVLRSGKLGKLAYANPKTAPYGQAAVEVMDRLHLRETLAAKLVQGASIGQTMSFVATGNADAGFVALSQVLDDGKLKSGSMWVVPQSLYEPIRQDAVLLNHGAGNTAAQALVTLLKSERVKTLIRAYGYEV